jgi:hypothetical protein
VATCRKCHPGANENFARYDPHASPRTSRNRVLRYTANFMHWLLIGVFVFFIPHTLLWLGRSLPERLRRQRRTAEHRTSNIERPTSNSE